RPHALQCTSELDGCSQSRSSEKLAHRDCRSCGRRNTDSILNRLAVAIAVCVVIGSAIPAAAVQGTGSLNDDQQGPTVGVSLEVVEPGSSTPAGGSRDGSARPFVSEAVPHLSAGFTLEHLCNAAN